MHRIVTLTTDFGTGSGYVAELKARLLHARAAFTLIDIAHDLPAHDVRAAAWLVGQTCPAFPPGTLHLCASTEVHCDLMDTTFLLGRETLITRRNSEMPYWREKLFVALTRNAGSPASYFGLPPNRVVELGTQVVL